MSGLSTSGLSTTVAVYDDLNAAQKDWAALEASTDTIDLADAALVQRNEDGDVISLQHLEHHGWGKGAVAGAVVGVLFPPSILGAAAVGAAGGGLVARITRTLNRGDIKDLGEVMDRGEVALVVISSHKSVSALHELLSGAKQALSRGDMSAADVQIDMDARDLNP